MKTNRIFLGEGGVEPHQYGTDEPDQTGLDWTRMAHGDRAADRTRPTIPGSRTLDQDNEQGQGQAHAHSVGNTQCQLWVSAGIETEAARGTQQNQTELENRTD